MWPFNKKKRSRRSAFTYGVQLGYYAGYADVGFAQEIEVNFDGTKLWVYKGHVFEEDDTICRLEMERGVGKRERINVVGG